MDRVFVACALVIRRVYSFLGDNTMVGRLCAFNWLCLLIFMNRCRNVFVIDSEEEVYCFWRLFWAICVRICNNLERDRCATSYCRFSRLTHLKRESVLRMVFRGKCPRPSRFFNLATWKNVDFQVIDLWIVWTWRKFRPAKAHEVPPCPEGWLYNSWRSYSIY